MLAEDVVNLFTLKDKQAEQVANGDLVFVFRDEGQSTQLVDGSLRNGLQIESSFDPLKKVRRRAHTTRTCFCKVANELLHFLFLAFGGEAHRQAIHRSELLVSLVHVAACLAIKCDLKFAKSISELRLIGSYKL